jgi:hypothetical protein
VAQTFEVSGNDLFSDDSFRSWPITVLHPSQRFQFQCAQFLEEIFGAEALVSFDFTAGWRVTLVEVERPDGLRLLR